MSPEHTASHSEHPATHRELPAAEPSFPGPRRREDPQYADAAPGWQFRAWLAMLTISILMAGTAAWLMLHKDNTPPSAAAAFQSPPETLPPGPPDAARDIYLGAEVPDPTPTPTPTPTPAPAPAAESPPARPLTDLDARYLDALTAAMEHVPETARAEFTAEIERLNTDAPMPSPRDGMNPELARLQSIYRLHLAKQPHR